MDFLLNLCKTNLLIKIKFEKGQNGNNKNMEQN
jgi:hypothetical protein